MYRNFLLFDLHLYFIKINEEVIKIIFININNIMAIIFETKNKTNNSMNVILSKSNHAFFRLFNNN